MASFDNNIVYLTTYLADVSTASSAFIAVPSTLSGEIVEIATVLGGAISVANATVTAEINGTAVTGSSITVAYSGSAAGDRDVAKPTAARSVTGGHNIEIISDGGSTGTAPLYVTVAIRQ